MFGHNVKGICLLVASVAVFFGACGCAEERNQTPGTIMTFQYLPYKFDLKDCGHSDFKEAIDSQHYGFWSFEDEKASDKPSATVEKFLYVCQYRVGVLYIESHGSGRGFAVETFVTKDARNKKYDKYVDPRGPYKFGGLIYKAGAKSYYHISVNARFLRRYFNSNKTLVVNIACGSWHLADDFKNARDSLGYRFGQPVSLIKQDMDNFWGCMEGTKPDGKEGSLRPTEQAHGYVKSQRPASALDFDRDSTKRTVLAPRALRKEPETCVLVGRKTGGVQFDCTMDTSVAPQTVVTAEGATISGHRWVRRYGIVFDVTAVEPVVEEVKFTVKTLKARSRNNGAYLDGNLEPAATNAVGPNMDDYTWKAPVCALEPDASTDKISYLDGETASITVTVVDQEGEPVARATIQMVMTTANGSVVNRRGRTNREGVKEFTYRTNIGRHGEGLYKVDLTATKKGYRSGKTSIEFWVTTIAPPGSPDP
jgi:hypothetical protein